MAQCPRGGSGESASPHEAASPREMPPEVTAAFFDMDTRQGAAQVAVAAESALNPSSPILGEWDTVLQRCYGASAAYLSLSAHDPAAQEAHQVHATRRGRHRYRQLLPATWRSALNRATSQAAAAAQKADASIAAAQGPLSQRLADVDGQWLVYPSVRTANDSMQSTVDSGFRA